MLVETTPACQSPSSGTVGPFGAIAAISMLLASLKTSVDALFVFFVLLGLNGLLDADCISSSKRTFARASSHAFRWRCAAGIKANAAMATATMIHASLMRVLSLQAQQLRGPEQQLVTLTSQSKGD